MVFGGLQMASFHSLFDGAEGGVAVMAERPDANGIAGFHDRVNGGGIMDRRGGAKLHRGHGDLLALSPFQGIPVPTPADFPERPTGR